MRILLNLIALLVELALIAGLGYLGARHPEYLAVVAAACTLLLGGYLEYARFAHEMPFYFERELSGWRKVLARIWTASETFAKAAVAGFIALLTFSGTDADRLQWTAILFIVVLFVGTTALLRVSLTWGRGAVRWGYFRLALPLGILFSAGIYALGEANLIKTASFSGIAYNATFNLAMQPKLADASEFLFQLSQATDNLIGTMLALVIPESYVPAVQIVASTNVLPGFMISVFAVAIAQFVIAIQGRDR
jgi:hypothetical protein